MNKEYISIKEFAARANISKQRVYQLLEKKLKPYCKTIENKKYIDISALEEFQNQKFSTIENNELETILKKNPETHEKYNFQLLERAIENNELETTLKKNPETHEKYNFQPLERTIENIVESFNKQLETKDKQINELTDMLKSMQEKQNELINALKSAQALHAGTIKEHIDSKAEKKGIWHWLFKFNN